MKRVQKGFTLIELMIVIAIIGILAAVAIPAYQDYIARSQMAEAMSLTGGLKADVSAYYSQNGTCPSNTSATGTTTGGIPLDTTITGNYVQKVTAKGSAPNCAIEATMKTTNISSGISGKTLTLTMTPTGGSFKWKCSSTAPQKDLPSSCTHS